MKEYIIYVNDIGDEINDAYVIKQFNKDCSGTIIKIKKNKCCILGVIEYIVYYE